MSDLDTCTAVQPPSHGRPGRYYSRCERDATTTAALRRIDGVAPEPTAVCDGHTDGYLYQPEVVGGEGEING